MAALSADIIKADRILLVIARLPCQSLSLLVQAAVN
jgi:hypothetical protein